MGYVPASRHPAWRLRENTTSAGPARGVGLRFRPAKLPRGRESITKEAPGWPPLGETLFSFLPPPGSQPSPVCIFLSLFSPDLGFEGLTDPAASHPQFLAQLKLMDYSLLVGIHDVERAEQEEVECEENDGEEEGESDGTHPVGTPPDSPGNTLNSSPPLAPGEFDPNIDVYGIKCHESKLSSYHLFLSMKRFDFCIVSH